jgi:tetratricopeptide (TPR) repeat protein
MGETLQRGNSAVARPPRRWIRRTVFLLPMLAVIGVLIWKFVWYPPREVDCKTASRTASEGVAVVICQREYERTKLPLTGAYLADLLRRSNSPGAASALANDLLSTGVRGDALQILGKIAEADHRIDDAIKLLQDARQVHRAQSNHVELARDDQALGRIQADQERYSEALQTIDECIAEARVGSDTLIEAYCRLTAATTLVSVGYFEAAQQELDRAAKQMSGDRDLAQLWYMRGNLEQEVDRGPLRLPHHEEAIVAFKHSLEFAKRAQFTAIVPSIHFNLAYSLAEINNTEEADRHLEEGTMLDLGGRYVKDRAQLAARIAYRRGNLDLAFSLNERLYPTLDDNDDQIDVCIMQARISLARNDYASAVKWAKLGVDSAEKVRAAQTLGELRPWVLASRRKPFELLFTALTRAGLVEEAVTVFDQWQGRTLIDEMARPSPEPSPGLSSTATRIQRLGQWLPAVAKAPLMTSDARAVTQALRKIDLVAFAVAEGDVWRLAASHGRFQLDRLGPIDALQDRLDRFMAAPTDPVLAGDLGALILPEDVVRKTDDPLYVVLDGPLAALPFVALRRAPENQPLIATRPVVRTPRLPVASFCELRADIGNALVLADAAGDLPDARRESGNVASLFGTTPLVGAAATSTALFAASAPAGRPRSSLLLHVAVHADVDSGGGALKLHDRTVSAPEISANKLGPALVVLSACSTASSGDPELADSLSTAFLAGGSQHVVATLRSVSDAGALELTSRFYRARGADDPVRVLANIQAVLARGDNKEWPNFAVFSNEACIPRS